jgi:hypothetical protein
MFLFEVELKEGNLMNRVVYSYKEISSLGLWIWDK